MFPVSRKRVVVHGRVQGVWFRAATEREAVTLGLRGWVRNLPGGQVEAVFEGPARNVDVAVEWCRSGPDRAVVDEIEVYTEEPEGLGSFSVRA